MKILFLVRHASRSECADLQSMGFRFAPTSSVVDMLARFMQVTTDELRPHLAALRNYKTDLQTLSPGVHLAGFVMRPK